MAKEVSDMVTNRYIPTKEVSDMVTNTCYNEYITFAAKTFLPSKKQNLLKNGFKTCPGNIVFQNKANMLKAVTISLLLDL